MDHLNQYSIGRSKQASMISNPMVGCMDAVQACIHQYRQLDSRGIFPPAVLICGYPKANCLFASSAAAGLLMPCSASLTSPFVPWYSGRLRAEEAAFFQVLQADIDAALSVLTAKQIKRCTVQYNLELDLPEDEKRLVLMECHFPWTDPAGKPLAMLIHSQDAGLFDQTMDRCCRIWLENDGERRMLLEKFYTVDQKTEPPLSRRELDILKGFSNGLNTRQVATTCYVSENTVKSHRKNIMRKLDVNKTTEAVRIALQHRWIA